MGWRRNVCMMVLTLTLTWQVSQARYFGAAPMFGMQTDVGDDRLTGMGERNLDKGSGKTNRAIRIEVDETPDNPQHQKTNYTMPDDARDDKKNISPTWLRRPKFVTMKNHQDDTVTGKHRKDRKNKGDVGPGTSRGNRRKLAIMPGKLNEDDVWSSTPATELAKGDRKHVDHMTMDTDDGQSASGSHKNKTEDGEVYGEPIMISDVHLRKGNDYDIAANNGSYEYYELESNVTNDFYG